MIEDGPERSEHALLVVPGASRRPRQEHDLSAVRRDVGLMERDLMPLRGLLNGSNERVQRPHQRPGPGCRDDLIRP